MVPDQGLFSLYRPPVTQGDQICSLPFDLVFQPLTLSLGEDRGGHILSTFPPPGLQLPSAASVGLTGCLRASRPADGSSRHRGVWLEWKEDSMGAVRWRTGQTLAALYSGPALPPCASSRCWSLRGRSVS